ncbi:MAG: DNA mismatch repair endonuclease MutL [bacterium]|nr:DNA mismatch repair endonuclease MutL [bacterium]
MTTATSGRCIHILPEFLANQIAAGEVVERPASVVKELVENSLDAGATSIEVTVEGGGVRLVRVADDGCGMGPDDAVAALERHATSKIASAEDLERVATLGFRGEALPSIAAVSRCTLTTALPGAVGGTRVEIEGGRIVAPKPVGCPPGTVVEIRDLFFNTPARRKFLRAPATEIAQIAQTVTSLALAHEAVAFKLVSSGRSVIAVPAAESLAERIAGLFGRQMAEALLPVAGEAEGLSVAGMTSPPTVSRSSRDHLHLVLNGRPFRDRRFAFAITKAYEGMLPPGRHPVAVVRLAADPATVDVNVHPTKQEVRFLKPGDVFDLLVGSVRAALEGVRPGPVSAPPPLRPHVSEDERRERVEEAIETFLARARPPGEARPADHPYRKTPLEPALSLERPQEPLPELLDIGRYVGQLYRTYLCFETEAGLVLIDQHAAHERVLYELLAGEREAESVATQELLVPLTLEVAPPEAAVLQERGALLDEVGLGLEPFGGQTVVVKRVPALWGDEGVEDKVRSLVEALVELDGGAPEDEAREKMLVEAACQAALKARRAMDEVEARSLVEALAACRSPLVCPHGRPVVLMLERAEVERRFQVK